MDPRSIDIEELKRSVDASLENQPETKIQKPIGWAGSVSGHLSMSNFSPYRKGANRGKQYVQ
jgi:hypothetical protein